MNMNFLLVISCSTETVMVGRGDHLNVISLDCVKPAHIYVGDASPRVSTRRTDAPTDILEKEDEDAVLLLQSGPEGAQQPVRAPSTATLSRAPTPPPPRRPCAPLAAALPRTPPAQPRVLSAPPPPAVPDRPVRRTRCSRAANTPARYRVPKVLVWPLGRAKFKCARFCI